MEEVAREHVGCLRAQELPPRRLATLRCRWYPQRAREQPGKAGDHRPVGPVQFRLGVLRRSTDLLARHQQLGCTSAASGNVCPVLLDVSR